RGQQPSQPALGVPLAQPRAAGEAGRTGAEATMGEATTGRRLTAAGRVAALLIALTAYLPWWAQRRFHGCAAPIRTIVAGRQSGKTHAAAEEVVRIMLRRPG